MKASNRLSAWIVLFVFGLLSACSSTQSIKNTGAVDDSWAGQWKGLMIFQNRRIPPRTISLDVVFTSTRIRAFYTDSTARIIHKPVNKLRFTDETVQFQVGYETARGLRTLLNFSGRLERGTLMTEVAGGVGGQALRARWEGRQHYFAESAPTKNATAMTQVNEQ